ncbi:hypothetical protein EHE22_08950 [Ochrobactrum pseudogrignonense]|uniref:Uncharacterized protein n=1 Tax=Brucella pseudogrignonensis TaxID=419475 RepID=A0A7Y3T4I0_9HYPH|nr:hypothetical protein [Brucella pseudogrignonensis]NNV20551.1 hypothetical protein [Brucella pseudogrignonensis]
MTPTEIAELFIRAAEVDRRLPQTDKPKALKAQSLGYVHSWEEMREWGDARHKEHRAEMFAQTKLSTADVTEWERCNKLILSVQDETRRRCLWNWAIAQAGGLSFTKWCAKQGFSREAGRRRKNRAILEIFGEIVRINGQNYKTALNGELQVCAETGQIQVTIGDDATEKQPLNWRQDRAISSEEDRSFEWAQARSARRRQKYAERQKAA